MQLTNTLLSLSALSALVSAAPTPAADADAVAGKYVAVIKGLPKDRYPDPMYIQYAQDFFGDNSLNPTTNKSAALSWTIGPNSDLVSTTKQTISIPDPSTVTRPFESITYVPYNGSQGTYVTAGKEILSRRKDFGRWQFDQSQYGESLSWETPQTNDSATTLPPEDYVHAVKFFLVK